MSKKVIVILLVLAVVLIGGLYWLKAPKFPVEYNGLCGVDDYINGNCIREYPKGTRSLPSFSENDWVFYVIKNKEQEKAWDKEYTKEELLKIAQEELERMKNYNDNYSGKQAYINRIQSFVDILSEM